MKSVARAFYYVGWLLHRMFFTKNDDMDLTQVYLGLGVLYFFYAFHMDASSKDFSVSVAAWSVFAGIFATLAIIGTSHVVSERLAKSKLPAEMSRAVASVQPNMFKDDERGDFKDREDV